MGSILNLRLWPPRYERDEDFATTVKFITQYKGTIDQILLFSEYSLHGYYPLEAFAQQCKLMNRRMKEFRSLGFPFVGINMMVTVGHMPEGEMVLEDAPFQHMIGHDGAASTSVYCPSDPATMQYIREKYKLAAGVHPNMIWIDDDMRMNHRGQPFTCFCERCVRDFCNLYGYKYTWREALVNALNAPENDQVRRDWLDYNVLQIQRICVAAEEAVHSVDPDIDFAFMSIYHTGINRWAKACNAKAYRPGGGFWQDVQPAAYIHKAFETGMQNAALPPELIDRQYEMESNLNMRFDKSVQLTMAECTASIIYGCTGNILNGLDPDYGKTLADKHDYYRRYQALKPVWDEMVSDPAAHVHGVCRGAYMAVHPLQMGNRARAAGEGYFSYAKGDIGGLSGTAANVIGEIGAPLTPDRAGGNVIVFSGKTADGFSNEELIAFLHGGVLMDYDTVNILNRRGLGAYCGGSVIANHPTAVYERYTDHPMNGGQGGVCRDARISFSGREGYVFQCDPEAQPLAEMFDYLNKPLGVCEYTYKNTLGGTVAVFGYAPWINIFSTEKRTQILTVLDALGAMPLRILDNVRICPVVRDEGSRRILMLSSLGCDEAEHCRLEMTGDYTSAKELISGQEITLERGGRGLTMDAGAFKPWEFKVILLTK